jgi:hypothetical protein
MVLPTKYNPWEGPDHEQQEPEEESPDLEELLDCLEGAMTQWFPLGEAWLDRMTPKARKEVREEFARLIREYDDNK